MNTLFFFRSIFLIIFFSSYNLGDVFFQGVTKKEKFSITIIVNTRKMRRLRMSRNRIARLHATLTFFAPSIHNPSVIFFTRANCCLLHFKTSPFLRGSLPSNDYTFKSRWSCRISFSHDCCRVKKKRIYLSTTR